MGGTVDQSSSSESHASDPISLNTRPSARRYALRSASGAASSTAAQSYAADLNESQREVVVVDGGPILVIAGAGTGKTRTLTYRAAHLLSAGLSPARLMLCTFTNRAAKEMITRVAEILGCAVRLPWAGTFHHVANVGLRKYARHVALAENYTILDRSDARDLMSACLVEHGPLIKQRRFPRAGLLVALCSATINKCLSVEEAVTELAPQFRDLTDPIEQILARYAERKRQLSLVDYDDLLVFFYQLLEDCPAVRSTLIGGFEHVLVDEYQDTNRLQARIVDLCASEHGNLTVMGDDAQTIYSFRGTCLDNIIDFPQRYPDARLFKLVTNYRSVPEILALANKSIRNNKRQFAKSLRATRSSGATPAYVPLEDTTQQASFVAQRILELHHDQEFPLGQIAVLYRAHAHSMELQIELGRRHIPFVVRSGVRYFEQAHIKDVVAFLRLTHNPADPLAWQRVLRSWSGVGRRSASEVLSELLQSPKLPKPSSILRSPTLVERLSRSAQQASERLAVLFDSCEAASVANVIRSVARSAYRDYVLSAFADGTHRMDDITHLADYAERYESMDGFLSDVWLEDGFSVEAAQPGQPPDEALVLSTVHQSKGLEWRAVFVIGLAEGRFPQAMAVKNPHEVEEERRLFYVAATRAKDELYLCYPKFLDQDAGPRRLLRPSRFVEELARDGVFPYERWDIC